jgi:hypothetical protein
MRGRARGEAMYYDLLNHIKLEDLKDDEKKNLQKKLEERKKQLQEVIGHIDAGLSRLK